MRVHLHVRHCQTGNWPEIFQSNQTKQCQIVNIQNIVAIILNRIGVEEGKLKGTEGK